MTHRRFNHGSRAVLNHRHLARFPGETLFARLARAVCRAECLPRKELFEAWEVARRVRRRLRGRVVVDLAAGHGLLAHTMLLLDDTSPRASCVDPNRPASAARLAASLVDRWPRLEGRIDYEETGVAQAPLDAGGLAVSIHGCGPLTDQVLDRAVAAGAPVAVLPCCHDLRACDTGHLDGWLDGPLAVDVTRAAYLRHAGYRVLTQTIPGDVTPMNRLLIGWPEGSPPVRD